MSSNMRQFCIIVAIVFYFCVVESDEYMKRTWRDSLDTFKECCSPTGINQCTLSYEPVDLALSKIRFVTYASSDIMGYAKWSLGMQYAYAEHHGHTLLRFSPETGHNWEQKDQRWNKIKILRDLMDETDIATDSYLIWLDADLVILDLDWKVSEFIDQMSSMDIVMARDSSPSSGLANTGFIIVRVNDWSRNMLSTWWNTFDRSQYSDQGVFSALYENMSESDSIRINLVEPYVLNSIFDAWDHQQDYHRVLHMAAAPTPLRAIVFRYGFESICLVITDEIRSSTVDWMGGEEFRALAGLNSLAPPEGLAAKITSNIQCDIDLDDAAVDRKSQLGLSRKYLRALRCYLAQYLVLTCRDVANDGLLWDVTRLRTLGALLQSSRQMGFGEPRTDSPDNIHIYEEKETVVVILDWIFNKFLEFYFEASAEEDTRVFPSLAQACVDAAYELLEQYGEGNLRAKKFVMSRVEPVLDQLVSYLPQDVHVYYSIKFLEFKLLWAAESGNIQLQTEVMRNAEARWNALIREIDVHDDSSGVPTRMSTLEEQRHEEMGRMLCTFARVLCAQGNHKLGIKKAQEGINMIQRVWGPSTGRVIPAVVTDYLDTCPTVVTQCNELQ